MSAVEGAVGLDGDYWNVGSGGRSRKPTETLDLATFEADKPIRPRKKRAPLTEQQKKAIAQRAEKRGIEKRIQNQIRENRQAEKKRERMSYIEAKDVVQREGIEIYEGIYVGGRLSAMNHEVLEQRGVKGILNVTNEVRMYFKDTGDFDYLRINADDHRDEPLHKHFDVGVQFIADQKKRGGVHVHCQMGQSRSCTMLVAYGMKCKGWDLEKTITHLHDKHACVGINDGFKRQLMQFEKSLYGSVSHNFFPGRAKAQSLSTSSQPKLSHLPSKEEQAFVPEASTKKVKKASPKKSSTKSPKKSSTKSPTKAKKVCESPAIMGTPFPVRATKPVKQASLFSFFSKVKAAAPSLESKEVLSAEPSETTPDILPLPSITSTPITYDTPTTDATRTEITVEVEKVSDSAEVTAEITVENEEVSPENVVEMGPKENEEVSPTATSVVEASANVEMIESTPTEAIEVLPSPVVQNESEVAPTETIIVESTRNQTESIETNAIFTNETSTTTPILTNGEKTIEGSTWSVLPIKRKLMA